MVESVEPNPEEGEGREDADKIGPTIMDGGTSVPATTGREIGREALDRGRKSESENGAVPVIQREGNGTDKEASA
jgi:hypothetical protein